MSEDTNSVSRRSLLKGAAVGGLGLVAGSTLAAESADAATRLKGSTVRWTTRGGGATGDKIAKAVNDAFTKKTGAKVIAQQVNSDDFQNNFAQIMQGSPDDAFGWMAGYRSNHFGEMGLLADLTREINRLKSTLPSSQQLTTHGLCTIASQW
jgi:multiple sugar transport system substrate-binding protein